MATTSRLAGSFSESVIRRSTQWSAEFKAVNLSQGFPTDEAPRELKLRAIEAIVGDRNQYADPWGTVDLRDAVASKMNRRHGLDLEGAHHVTITCGATEALMATLLAVVDPDEEVILFEPSYENFWPQCLIARARPVHIPLVGPAFALDRDRLAAAFSDRTAAILVNNPNNPCGKVFSREDLEFIAELCVKHDAFLIADEVYEHLVYDEREHHCVATIPSLEGRYIVVSSFSKTYHVTGWRVGYAVADAAITSAIRRCHDFLSQVAPTPFQDAATVAMGFGEEYYSWLLDHYVRKRDFLCHALNEVGLSCSAPEGAYYVLADMSGFDFEDSIAFCRYLLTDIGVAAVPWTSFYSNADVGRHRLRFTFSKSEAILSEAASRLTRLRDSPRRRDPR